MAEDAGGGTSGGIGKSISFVAETISKTAADVAGTVWNHLTQTQFSVDIDQAPKLIAALGGRHQAICKRPTEKSERPQQVRRLPAKTRTAVSLFLAIRQSAGDEEGGYRLGQSSEAA